jgi:hypothetical protein
VLALIKFGDDAPARAPDREIEALKARADSRGVIRLEPPPPPSPRRKFVRGEKVSILAGGSKFAALHTGCTRRQRELVLIEVLGGRREIAVSAHLVEAAS